MKLRLYILFLFVLSVIFPITSLAQKTNSIKDSLVIYEIYKPQTGEVIGESPSFFDAVKIEKLIEFVRENYIVKGQKIIIEYHTDSRGSENENYKYSIHLLEKLKLKLKNHFFNEIEEGLIEFCPKGESLPIFTEEIINKEKDSKKREKMHKKNRRLVVICL